jgi:putative hydrolase of the HAD superfamily
MVKTIFLDIGRVLVPLNYAGVLARLRDHSPLSSQEITVRLQTTDTVALYETGRLTTDRFYERICGLLEMRPRLEVFKELWRDLFRPGPEDDGKYVAEGLFERLRERYRLVALSNTNEMHFGFLWESCPVIRRFHDYVLSHLVGFMKPQPDIYRLALEKAEAPPEQTLFVDDLQANLEGAAQFGIRGMLFTEAARLEADLVRQGLIDELKQEN